MSTSNVFQKTFRSLISRMTGRSFGLLVLPLVLSVGSLGVGGCQTTETQDPGGLHQHEAPQRPDAQQQQQQPQQQEQQPRQW